jgi:zinc protease
MAAANGAARTCAHAVCAVLFGIFVCLSLAGAGLRENVGEHQLSNGLKVLLLENHKAPLVTVQIWYRVGSRNEAWGKTGLSHMLEHMMFKGTKKVGPEEFSRIIQENGGNDNAFTSSDFTAYFENLSTDRVSVALELESDRMQNLMLREEDFRTERMVVMEERRLRTDDNPTAYLLEQVAATAFQTQPYHWPTIGWMEDIARFTLDDLKTYHRSYYIPVNAFLVVVGDFRKKEILLKIQNAFGACPGGVMPDQRKDIDPPQAGERRIFVSREAELPYIVMAYHVPNLHDADSYVLEVIATILSGGKSSRLYQRLVRGKQLVLEADAQQPLLSHDPDLFYLSAEPLPGKEVADVEQALDQEIVLLQKQPVPAQELEKAKNQLEAAFVFGQDSLFYQAMLLARYEIAGGWHVLQHAILSRITAPWGFLSRFSQKRGKLLRCALRSKNVLSDSIEPWRAL